MSCLLPGEYIPVEGCRPGKAEAKFQVWSTAQGGHTSESIKQGDSRLTEEAGDGLPPCKATRGRKALPDSPRAWPQRLMLSSLLLDPMPSCSPARHLPGV